MTERTMTEREYRERIARLERALTFERWDAIREAQYRLRERFYGWEPGTVEIFGKVVTAPNDVKHFRSMIGF